MQRQYKFITSTLPDGSEETEVYYDDESDMQNSNDVADTLQTHSNDVADTLRTHSNDVADTLQTYSNDIAEPQQPKRTPRKPLNTALVSYLANDENFQKSVYGWFMNVEDLIENQKNAPAYQCKFLNMLGFSTNVEELTRVYIPEARVERLKKIMGAQIKIWQKISAVLVVAAIILFLMRPSENRVVADTGSATKINQDSAITWKELTEMLRVYNASSNTKIWYAPPLYREINEKNITDVQKIKELFDKRTEEIKRLQNN